MDNASKTIIAAKRFTMHIAKLPSGEWLNLALARRLQVDDNESSLVVVTWENGDTQVYRGDDAAAIVQAWEDAYRARDCVS